MRQTPVPLWNKSGFEDDWMEDTTVASKLWLLMFSTDRAHKERLADQFSTMEQRPHQNRVLAAKGHTQ